MGYSPWGLKESDTTERLTLHTSHLLSPTKNTVSCMHLCEVASVLSDSVTLWAPGKNSGVSCHFLLQGIFPTQGLNLRLSHLLH